MARSKRKRRTEDILLEILLICDTAYPEGISRTKLREVSESPRTITNGLRILEALGAIKYVPKTDTRQRYKLVAITPIGLSILENSRKK
jgi:DNA-binding MarR family transcriptional regulator